MATNINAAADSLLALAEQFRPMQEVAQALKDIGSVEQATKERKAALDEATKQHEAMKLQVAQAGKDLAAIKAQQADQAAAHQNLLKGSMLNTQAEIEKLVTNGRLEAARIIADAKAEAERAQAISDATLATAKEKLAAVNAQIADATAKRDAILAHHKDVKQSIDAMREAARKVA